jgi:hyperosmotically inducible periplasmic protein
MTIKRLLASFVLLLTLLTGASAAGKPASDDYISDSIREKLAADTVVKGGNIDVEVKDGAVVLKGRVEEEKQKSRAEKIAKKVNGVKSVKNDLQIAHP